MSLQSINNPSTTDDSSDDEYDTEQESNNIVGSKEDGEELRTSIFDGSLGGGVKKIQLRKNNVKKLNIKDKTIESMRLLDNRTGCSLRAIKKYISANWPEDMQENRLHTAVKKYIKVLLLEGQIIQTKGNGVGGSFRLVKELRSEKKKKKTALEKPAKKGPTLSAKLKVKKDASSVLSSSSSIEVFNVSTKVKVSKKSKPVPVLDENDNNTEEPKQKPKKPRKAVATKATIRQSIGVPAPMKQRGKRSSKPIGKTGTVVLAMLPVPTHSKTVKKTTTAKLAGRKVPKTTATSKEDNEKSTVAVRDDNPKPSTSKSALASQRKAAKVIKKK